MSVSDYNPMLLALWLNEQMRKFGAISFIIRCIVSNNTVSVASLVVGNIDLNYTINGVLARKSMKK